MAAPPASQLLLDRGADIEARGTTWNSTPLEWAAVGSGERPATAPDPDWPGTMRILLEHGASAAQIELTQDDPKPPSYEVAAHSGPTAYGAQLRSREVRTREMAR
jgi:hypothetical protein